MSVKDQFNIRGLDTTLGYTANAFAPAECDAALVQTLKKLGAVIISKTNLPQSIMVRPHKALAAALLTSRIVV
jgi:Asp-tRNA(Asn)/Glu-tRNA(Gln) amidotransferase A subunit family amidase